MSEKLNVAVKQTKTGYEGTVDLPGLKSTKIARKDGSTTFPSSSAVKTVARSIGKRLSMEVNYNEPAKAAKKLTKKGPKSSTKKSPKSSSKKSAPKAKKASSKLSTASQN